MFSLPAPARAVLQSCSACFGLQRLGRPLGSCGLRACTARLPALCARPPCRGAACAANPAGRNPVRPPAAPHRPPATAHRAEQAIRRAQSGRAGANAGMQPPAADPRRRRRQISIREQGFISRSVTGNRRAPVPVYRTGLTGNRSEPVEFKSKFKSSRATGLPAGLTGLPPV